MPRLYKSLTAVLGLSGCLSLIITGELNPVFLVPGIAILPGYYRYIKGYPQLSKWSIGGLSVAVLALMVFDVAVVSRDFFMAIAHMTVVFQAVKSFDLREPWDNLQVYFMALLQLVIASELSHSMSVGAVFAAFLVVFIAAMVLSHFIGEHAFGRVGVHGPIVVISLAAFIMTTLLFVSIPRLGGGVLSVKGHRSSVGFSENVDFNSFGNVLLDPTVVMRVETEGPKLPYYFRGLTLDYFDGHAWRSTITNKSRVDKSEEGFAIGGGEGAYTIQRVYAEPMDTSVLFGLGEIVRIEAPGDYLLKDASGALFIPSKRFRRSSYTVYSLDGEGRIVMDRQRYLSLPEGTDRIASLALLVSDGKVGVEKARAIEKHLKENYSYELKLGNPTDGFTPIEDFLFNSKKGFCQHFATAMALMLRTQGIPARIVTGFSGGEENAFGNYVIIRQSNAHSWVEAAIDGRWVSFDPTPLAPPATASGSLPSIATLYLDSLKLKWYRYIVGFTSYDQRSIVRAVSSPVVFDLPETAGFKFKLRPIYLAVLIIPIFLFASRMFSGWVFIRHSKETRRYLKFRNEVRKKGGLIGESSTSKDVLREAIKVGMDESAAGRFIGEYEEARFGKT